MSRPPTQSSAMQERRHKTYTDDESGHEMRPHGHRAQGFRYI
jgi:hypothetical protein